MRIASQKSISCFSYLLFNICFLSLHIVDVQTFV